MEKKIQIRNKKARFSYELLDEFTAGIKLYGTEIKAIREGKASISESFCQLKEHELFVINMFIDEYRWGNQFNHKTKRERKLLLNRRELQKIRRKTLETGLTIVPTLLFVNERGLAKLRISIARGKKIHDKRQLIKKKDLSRDLQRIVKNF